jgi:hypothetical protein
MALALATAWLLTAFILSNTRMSDMNRAAGAE